MQKHPYLRLHLILVCLFLYSGIYSQNECADSYIFQKFFVPFEESQTFEVFKTLYPDNDVCECNYSEDLHPKNQIQKFVSIVVSRDRTQIIWDHWEDGYELDLNNPTQATTVIYGDGNPFNGVLPEYPNDEFVSGDVINILTSIQLPNDPNIVKPDSRDRFGTTGNVSTTVATWADGSETLLAGALIIDPFLTLGTDFEIPVGIDNNINEMFEYVGAFIQAYEDDTEVLIDYNADGLVDHTISLDMGEIYLQNGNFHLGASVQSNKGIMLSMITGDICTNYESRWYTLFSKDKVSNRYIIAVGTPDFAPTYVHMYNPNNFDIDVLIETSTALIDTVLNIEAGKTAYFENPNFSGSRLSSEFDFQALATIDSKPIEGMAGCNAQPSNTHDWGYTIFPEKLLRQQIIGVPFAPGKDPTYEGNSTENSSPVWLVSAYPENSTSTGKISVCVDYNGDGGPESDALGNKYDIQLKLDELESMRIYDPDGDQTCMALWVCDGSDAVITSAWGQDPNVASVARPAFDVGTTVINSPAITLSKSAQFVYESNANGLVDVSDTLEYCLCVSNGGKITFNKNTLIVQDELPSYLTYIENSTYVIFENESTLLLDDIIGETIFPIDADGYIFPENLFAKTSFSVCYKTEVNSLPPNGESLCNSVSLKEGGAEISNTHCLPVKCDLNVNSVLVSNCDMNKAMVDFEIDWKNAQNDQLLEVSLAGYKDTLSMVNQSMPYSFGIEVNATGMEEAYSIRFIDSDNCSLQGTVNLPGSCVDGFTLEKDFVSINSNSNGTHTVEYKISVENTSSSDGDYNLFDAPSFDTDFTINSAEYKLQTASSFSGLSPNVNVWTLASDKFLASGNVDAYILRVNVSLDLKDGVHGDDQLATCGSNGGTPKPGEALYNEARLDINDDQIIDLYDSACGDLEIFDLALRKTILSPTNYSLGSVIEFQIEVFNQGFVAANNIEISDYIPCGFSFDPAMNMGWSLSGNTARYTMNSALNPGDSRSVIIRLKLQACNASEAFVNHAEISNAKELDGSNGNDIDSTPDNDPNNDVLLDDEILSNNDEDDHDIAVVSVFDLALRKTMTSNGPFKLNDLINFKIEVFNQGIDAAKNIMVTDYIPCGLEFDAAANPGWTLSGNTATRLITNTILSGETRFVEIKLRLVACTSVDAYLNVAEISAAQDINGDPGQDTDSTPDNIKDNDGTPSNDEILSAADEDDHDPELVQVFDLAVRKTITTPAPYTFGQDINFQIEVFNQGNVSARNIEIQDYIPCGYSFDASQNANWTLNGTTAQTRISSVIFPGQSHLLNIRLKFIDCNQNEAHLNKTEILSAQNEDGSLGSDIDSNPDADPSNDALEDDQITSSSDEDDHDVALPGVFDLALIKTITSGSNYQIGDVITFNIEVHNQGTINAKNIEVSDHVPCGLSFESGLNPGWAFNDGIATQTISNTLNSGLSTSLQINLRLQACAESDAYLNIAEISKAHDEFSGTPTDSDSTPDHIKDNDGTPVNNALLDSNDEDDHDPELVEIFDLAIRKTITTVGPYVIGQDLSFAIEVFNQGSVLAKNIDVQDYIPCGYTFDASQNPTWTLNGTIATRRITESIHPGESKTINIVLKFVDCSSTDAHLNEAEILSAQNEDGTQGSDIDSTPDSDSSNDALEDDQITSLTDEDDHDIAKPSVFDLALRKSTVGSGPYQVGQTIDFKIEVFNQGNEDAKDIEIVDYIPCGFTFDQSANPNWTLSGTKATTTIASVLNPNTSTSVHLKLILSSCAELDAYLNIAEISKANDSTGTPGNDVDSTPDTNSDNDGAPLNDEVLDPSDEDDHDPELIDVFDLAIKKTVVTPSPYEYSDDITFGISVYNQGNVAAKNITIQDYIPCGYTFDQSQNPNWSLNGSTASYLMSNTLSAGQSETINIKLKLVHCESTGAYVNTAEIGAAQDEDGNPGSDIDSAADDDKDNDDLIDDEITDPNDEDDHDIASVGIFDLALKKEVLTAGPYRVGDNIDYQITVYNQGTADAKNIEVVDYLPCGLEFNAALNPSWTLSNGKVKTSIASLAANTQESVILKLTLQSCSDNDAYRNVAEIAKAQDENGFDGDDVDSTADEDKDNDGDPIDDATTDPSDQDDHDPAVISVFDLAIKKTILNGSSFDYGDDVIFEMTVYNQGNVAAKDITIRDYIPCGYTFDASQNSAWSLVNGVASYTFTDVLNPGDSEQVQLILQFKQCSDSKAHINQVEISEALDANGNPTTDSDSTPDNDPDNDLVIDDEISNPNDEDDQDIAVVDLFDLALRKQTMTQGPYLQNAQITYRFEVFNQGTIDAKDIVVTDYIPCGLNFDSSLNPGWVQTGSNVSNTISSLLTVGSSTFVELILTLGKCAEPNAYLNIAEITSSNDGEGEPANDVDSDFDSDPENDGDPKDDEIDDPTDEDDHDIEKIEIFDLALIKTTENALTQSGEMVEFKIEVHNQGTEEAHNVKVVDYIRDDFEFVPNMNPNWKMDDGKLYYTYTDAIMPSTAKATMLYLQLKEQLSGKQLLNYAEVVSFANNAGVDKTEYDVDSKADSDEFNDVGGDIGTPLDNMLLGIGFVDEDDHDGARLAVCDDIACAGNVNISLDANCEVNITAGMVLSEMLLAETDYTVTVRDQQGNIVGNVFTISDLGKTFEVTVQLNGCPGQTCWSQVLIEDKLAPVVNCADVTVNCGAEDTAAEPTITENCGASLILLSSEINKLDCDNDFVAEITKTWMAEDSYGNTSLPCTQTIAVRRPDFGLITFPLAANPQLTCNDSTDPSNLGVPLFDGMPLYPMQSDQLCNVVVNYTDQTVFDLDCHTRIMRTWDIIEWFCTGTGQTANWVQMIDIIDTTDPVITCPANMVLSSTNFNNNNCTGLVTLPPASVTDDCNNTVVDVIYPGGFLDNQNGGEVSLPIGPNMVTYIAYDACGNSSSCEVEFIVADDVQPIAICETNTVVGLTSAGTTTVYAATFDNGSYDNCGIVLMDIRRMNDNCGNVSNEQFGPSVQFCCEDAGTVQQIVFRVHDAAGNVNQCMVNVEVQDKIAPILSCPTNQSVDCGTSYDLNNLDAIFGSATVTDNCPDNIQINEAVTEDFSNCGTGTLTRVFTITANGIEQSCSQVITFTDPTPLTVADITWPADFTDNTICSTDLDPSSLPNGFNEPVVTDNFCTQVAFNYVDDTFYFDDAGQTCVKVVRTWTVIDWCQQVGGTFAQWTHQQELKVSNSVAPVFVTSMAPINIETFDAACAEGLVSTMVGATDDCTATMNLEYSYEIYNEEDGSLYTQGIGNSIDLLIPLGEYRIEWTVTDACGNYSSSPQLLNIVNAKPPTAVCVNGLSADLVPMDLDNDGTFDDEMVTLNVSQFDGGSNHVCGYGITLSFSADVTNQTVTFDCTDIGMQVIQLWVTDENGNTSFCETFVDVQDNNNVDACGNTGGIVISGQIMNFDQSQEMSDIELELTGDANMFAMSQSNGDYSFNGLQEGGTYELSPIKNDDPMNGISTLDLVLIQKHILGLQAFDSPDKYIAADINKSNSISAVDLIELRKLILGVYTEFPNNESWRFVEEGFTYSTDESFLSELNDAYAISGMSEDMVIDYKAIKVGDINGTVEYNLQENQTEVRTSETLDFMISDVTKIGKGEYELYFTADNFDEFDGFQIGLEIPRVQIQGVNAGKLLIASTGYHIDEAKNIMTINWHKALDQRADDKQEYLFSIQFQADQAISRSEVSLNDELMSVESYIENGVHQVSLRSSDDELISESLSVYPNPVKKGAEVYANIPSTEDTRAEYTIVNVKGEVMAFNTLDVIQGQSEYQIEEVSGLTSGVYFIHFKLNGQKILRKLTVIK